MFLRQDWPLNIRRLFNSRPQKRAPPHRSETLLLSRELCFRLLSRFVWIFTLHYHVRFSLMLPHQFRLIPSAYNTDTDCSLISSTGFVCWSVVSGRWEWWSHLSSKRLWRAHFTSETQDWTTWLTPCFPYWTKMFPRMWKTARSTSVSSVTLLRG